MQEDRKRRLRALYIRQVRDLLDQIEKLDTQQASTNAEVVPSSGTGLPSYTNSDEVAFLDTIYIKYLGFEPRMATPFIHRGYPEKSIWPQDLWSWGDYQISTCVTSGDSSQLVSEQSSKHAPGRTRRLHI